jgi:hypothetical protein
MLRCSRRTLRDRRELRTQLVDLGLEILIGKMHLPQSMKQFLCLCLQQQHTGNLFLLHRLQERNLVGKVTDLRLGG